MTRGWTSWIIALVVLMLRVSTSMAMPFDLESDEELVNVRTDTHVARYRRDTGEHTFDFPDDITYTVEFKDHTVTLNLHRVPHIIKAPTVVDESGNDITIESKDDVGVYQDPSQHASALVICNEHTLECSLHASLTIFTKEESRAWTIRPVDDRALPNTHIARRAVPVFVDKHTEEKIAGLANVLLPSDIDLNGPGVNIALNKMREPNRHGHEAQDSRVLRKTRGVWSSDCYYIEVCAIVEQSVWQYFLDVHGEIDIDYTYYSMLHYFQLLYAQVDLRFSMIPMVKSDLCIRVYLSQVSLCTSCVWAENNMMSYEGYSYLNGRTAIAAAQGETYASNTDDCDVYQWFTRKDIAFNPNNDNVYYSSFRGLSYLGTACHTAYWPYAVSIIELNGDAPDLVVARNLGHLLGSDVDGHIGCSDDDWFIMSEHETIPPLAYAMNQWLFSMCSLNKMWWHINENPNCLQDNHFTPQEWNDTLTVARLGSYLSPDEQCQERWGPNSTQCDNTTFPPNMCEVGIKCSVGEKCNCTVRVYDGTPCEEDGSVCHKGICDPPPTTPTSPPTTPTSPPTTTPTSPPTTPPPPSTTPTAPPTTPPPPSTTPTAPPTTPPPPSTTPTAPPTTPPPPSTTPTAPPTTPPPPSTTPTAPPTTPPPPSTTPTAPPTTPPPPSTTPTAPPTTPPPPSTTPTAPPTTPPPPSTTPTAPPTTPPPPSTTPTAPPTTHTYCL